MEAAKTDPEQSSIKRLRKKSAKAFQYRRRWDYLADEVYRYAIPYRNAGEYESKAAKRTDRIFDGTAPKTAVRFAAGCRTT